MDILWYKNPKIIIDNYMEIIPYKHLSDIRKINAIARFAIYYAIIILLLKLDTKFLSVSVIILLASYSASFSEKFSIEESNEECTKPTDDNPIMNFTMGDYYENPDKPKACKTEEVKDEITEKFNKKIVNDPFDLFDRKINQRQFVTLPTTTIVNDQNSFAQALYGGFGECKDENKNCARFVDNRYHHARYNYTY